MAKRYQSSPRALEQKGSTSHADVAIEPGVGQPGRKELTESTAPSIRWRSFYALVPVVIALITSINSLWNYFAADDLQQVLGSSFIKRIGNLPAAFTTSVWSFTAADIIFTVDSYFRPLFNTLFILNYALFGTAPWGWHLVNVLIHAGVTLLVFVVAREVIGRNWVGAITATLFAVHPSHAESIAWVSGITDPLMMLMLLPAFYFYLRFRKQGLKYQIVCALAFFFLGLLCKETAVALPVVVAFCELFYFKSEMPIKQRLLRASKILALFAIPIAVYLLIRYNALSSLVLGGEPRYPLVQSLLTVPLAIAKYLKLMFIPWGYSYQHPTDFVESSGSVLFLVPVALLLAIVIAIARLKSRELTFCAVWFIVMLAPALAALRQFEPAYLVQDRYLYAPSIGICLAIALGIEWFARRDWFGTRQRAVATAVAALLVLVWGAVLMRQNRVWDDTLAVNKHSVAVNPREAIAHDVLSRTYYEAGRPREAEAEARVALDLDPRCASAYVNLSYFARMSGKLDKACEYLENGIAAVPEGFKTRHDLATMYLNLGLLYGQRKMFELGEENLLRSIEISPRAVAWYYTGQFYSDQGRFEEARDMYERTLAHVPRWFAPIHLRLGLIYEALGNTSQAEGEFERYLALAPPEAPDRESVSKHLTTMRGGPPTK